MFGLVIKQGTSIIHCLKQLFLEIQTHTGTKVECNVHKGLLKKEEQEDSTCGF